MLVLGLLPGQTQRMAERLFFFPPDGPAAVLRLKRIEGPFVYFELTDAAGVGAVGEVRLILRDELRPVPGTGASVAVLSVEHKCVRVGIEAPREVVIERGPVRLARQRNAAAVGA